MLNLYDVIIIGGGIMGCSAAYELAQRGLSVALFEKRMIGEGPTGRSSAIIRQHYSNELTARMALYSLRVFQDFEEQVGDQCGFTSTGFVALVEEKDRAGLEANVALQRDLGIRTELLSTEALGEILPRMESGDLVAAAYEPDSGYADPYLTVNAYARAARRAGAAIYQDTEVGRIHLEKGRVTGIDTQEGRFGTPVVLNCTGAWAARVAATAGVGLPIHSCRVQVAFFRRPAGHEAAHPVVGDFCNAIYFRSETGNITLVGLIDPAEENAMVNPDDYDERMDADFVLDAGERLNGGHRLLDGCRRMLHEMRFQPGSMMLQFAGRGVKIQRHHAFQSAALIAPQDLAECVTADVGQPTNRLVGETLALQPQDVHPLAHPRVWMVVP